MNKQKRYTAMGLALSFIIAVGGWWLTNELLDRKERVLLSATGSVQVNTPLTSPTIRKDTEATTQALPVLSEAEMFQVLLNWEAEVDERPHEPEEGQLSMEQAIVAGKFGLSYFYEQGIIPAELLEYDKTNAYLCKKQPRGEEFQTENQFLDPGYSYWTITFYGENKSSVLVINAMTGQIWKAAISGPGLNEIATEKVLDAFVSYLALDGGGSYVTDGTTAAKSFADGKLRAVARNRFSSVTATGSQSELSGYFRIYLSTQAPNIE